MFKAHMKNAFLNMDVCKNLYQGGYTHRNAQGLISGGAGKCMWYKIIIFHPCNL